MDYAEARTWLESLGEFHMEFGLDRVRTVLEQLGNPERCAPAIHVAGTNGKGMTCAFASSILRHAGKKVGLYTSPHLSRPNERIALSGKPIDDAGFASALTKVRDAIDATKTPLTYFEAVTCAAFSAFRDAAVDVMVVEVGLGGRLDATNVIDPVVSVITSVSLDHTHILGHTIEEIAAEKAGIVKPGRPVVIPLGAPLLRDAVLAKDAGGRLWECGPHVGAGQLPGAAQDQWPPAGTWSFMPAVKNEAAAMATLAARLVDATITYQVIEEALKKTSWPGRAEVREWTDKSGAKRAIVLDGGHNPAAAAEVASFMLSLYTRGVGRHALLFAAMSDKDRLGMLRAHARNPTTHRPAAIVCTTAGTARSATPRQLAEEARSVFGDTIPIEAHEPIDAALERAAEIVAPPALLLVTGSLYLVGRVREIVTGGPPTALG